jgi:hypothetical protein
VASRKLSSRHWKTRGFPRSYVPSQTENQRKNTARFLNLHIPIIKDTDPVIAPGWKAREAIPAKESVWQAKEVSKLLPHAKAEMFAAKPVVRRAICINCGVQNRHVRLDLSVCDDTIACEERGRRWR